MHIRRLVSAGLASIVLIVGVGSDPRPTITFVGDSITSGWSIGDIPGYLVVNAGVERQSTRDILPRFEHTLLQSKARYAVILAGTNDIYFGIPKHETKHNIGAMLDVARLHHVTPILCSILPTSRDWFESRSPQNIIELNQWLREVADERGLIYIDYYSAMVESDKQTILDGTTTDGLHPNNAGYTIMQRVLLKALH